MKCGLVQGVKRNSVRWLGHIVIMEDNEFVIKECLSYTECPNRSGRPHGRWKDRLKDYMNKRGTGGRGCA